MTTLFKLLKPSWGRIGIFVIFTLVALAGYVQSWAFSGKDAGVPKPPFYDFLDGFPFWLIWAMSLLPLALLSNGIVAIAGYDADFIMRGPYWLFWAIQLGYLWLVSCLITFAWTKIRCNERETALSKDP